MDQQSLKALVIGATGGVGRVLIAELTNSPKWSEVTVIVRRKLEEWESLPNKHKLKIIQIANLDELGQTEKWNNFKNYNSFFSVLGTTLSDNDELIKKVELDYLKYGAQIAKLNRIPHFSTVTVDGMNEGMKKSWFFIRRLKAQVEEYLMKEQFSSLTLNRPGFILNRVNYEHIGESLFKYIPFAPKINVQDLAKAIRLDAEQVYLELSQQNQQPMVRTHSNKELLNMAK